MKQDTFLLLIDTQMEVDRMKTHLLKKQTRTRNVSIKHSFKNNKNNNNN